MTERQKELQKYLNEMKDLHTRQQATVGFMSLVQTCPNSDLLYSKFVQETVATIRVCVENLEKLVEQYKPRLCDTPSAELRAEELQKEEPQTGCCILDWDESDL